MRSSIPKSATKKRLLFQPKKPKNESQKPFAVLDIEAKPRFPGEPINTCFLGAGFYDGQSYRRFDTIDALLKHCLDDRYKDWLIYAHNGTGYDFLFLLHALIPTRDSFEAYRTGGRFFLRTYDRMFLDSMCVLRGSLRSVAKSFGVVTQKWENLPDDFYINIEKYDWKSYLKSDCYCLYECIAKLREATAILGVELRPTLASTAMMLFQSQYLDSAIECVPWSHNSEEKIRQSYVGGRVEIFKHHMRQGGSWDINSSYPFEMLHDVPTDLAGDGLGNVIPDYGFVKAKVSIPLDEHIPPLHYRTKDTLYFPTGQWQGWYTSKEAELCRAKYGNKSLIVSEYLYYNHAPIFKGYVNDLYAKRLAAKKANNPALAEACKGLLNSLYGKTGMVREREKIVNGVEYYNWPWNDPKAIASIKRHGGKSLQKMSLMCTEYSKEHYVYGIPTYVERAPYILPQIASWIVAGGRIHMQRLLDIAGTNACYCDTDAVYSECDDRENPYTKFEGKDLGQLKQENKIAWAHFASPKVYLLACRGIQEHLHESYGNITLKGAAKGLPRDTIYSVQNYIAGEKIKFPHVSGAIETLRKTGNVQIESTWGEKQAQYLKTKRHPDGRAWRVEELINGCNV